MVKVNPLKTLVSLAIIGIGLNLVSCGDDSSNSSTSCTLSSTTTSSSGVVNIADPSFGGDEVAQSIEIGSESLTLDSIDLSLLRVGSASGTMTVSIQGDSSDAPDGATVGTLSASRFINQLQDDDYRWYRFTFSGSTTLTANTTYWIRVQVTYTPSTSNYVSWEGSDADVYEEGQAKSENGSSGWDVIDTGRDLTFRIGCSGATFN